MMQLQKKLNVQASMSDKVFDLLNIALMVVIMIIILYPLYFVVMASFTEPRIVNTGKLILIPSEFYTGGYESTFRYDPLWTGYLNSILCTVVGTLISIAVTVTSAYALSRKDMFGQSTLMMLFSFTMFFSGGLIPNYILMKSLNIYDTFWVMVLPSSINVMNLVVCRTFFQTTIPRELWEAASIDGCDDFVFFFKIVLPVSSTIIAVLALFYGSAKWNSYFDALIYLIDSKKMPLQIVLRNLLLIGQSTDMVGDAESMAERQRQAEQLKYCIIVVSAAPLLCLYPFLQKYFAKGVMIGSLKG